MYIEFRIDRSFVEASIERLTEEGQLLAFLAVSVYIPCKGTVRRDSLNRLCSFIPREVEKMRYTATVLMGDWNVLAHHNRDIVNFWHSRCVRTRNAFNFRERRESPGQQLDKDAILTTLSQYKVHLCESKRSEGIWTPLITIR